MKWWQIFPATPSLFKPGNHHPIWLNSSKSSFYPRTPLIDSNYWIQQAVNAPWVPPGLMPCSSSPQHMIHHSDFSLAENLDSLVLLSLHCHHLEKLNPGLIQLPVLWAPTPVSKHECRKSILLHGLVFMDSSLSWACPAISFFYPPFKANILVKLSPTSL